MITASCVDNVAKSELRDVLTTGIQARSGAFYQQWRTGNLPGFDCLLDSEVDGTPQPDGRPLLVVESNHVKFNDRQSGGLLRMEYTLDVTAYADASSGSIPSMAGDPGADDQLAADAAAVLRDSTTRATLAAAGLECVRVVERRDSVRSGLHQNCLSVTFTVTAQEV